MENIYSAHIIAEQIGGNMTIKELLEKIQDLEFTKEQEEHIKKCLGIKDTKWQPKFNEKYYYVDKNLSIQSYHFENDNTDNTLLFTNNCFKTTEEAEFRLEQIKVYNELKNFADENNDEIAWKNHTSKYHIGLDYTDNSLYTFDNFSYRYIGQIYFSSQKVAQQAIEKVGADRIKKYLFGVE